MESLNYKQNHPLKLPDTWLAGKELGVNSMSKAGDQSMRHPACMESLKGLIIAVKCTIKQVLQNLNNLSQTY